MRRVSWRAQQDSPLLVVSATKHGAEHLVEHAQRGVGKNHLYLAREHDQRRKAAWRVEARDIARNENGDFLGDCGVTRAVNALFPIRPDGESTDDLQPLDKAGQIFLARRFWPLPQPRKRRASMFVVDDQQRLQRCNRVVWQPLNKVLVRALASKSSRRQRDFLQGGGSGQQNASFLQICDHRGNDCVAPIRTGRLFEGDMNNRAYVFASEGAHGEIGLKFAEMLPACFAAPSV